jgi:hypothetical protein
MVEVRSIGVSRFARRVVEEVSGWVRGFVGDEVNKVVSSA